MMGYITDLRELVGHRPLVQVGASVIVMDEQGRMLLQLRTDDHTWDCAASGSLELGETVEDAARRELLEETGLTAHSLELLGVFSGPENHYIYPNGDEVYNVDIVYLCRSWSGAPVCQAGEVDELHFFAPDELPANLSALNRQRPWEWGNR